MSSSSTSTTTTTTDHSQSTMTALPTTTKFLPVLDDLLSPDFRPVTHPPIATPLQTPTTANNPSNCLIAQQQQQQQQQQNLIAAGGVVPAATNNNVNQQVNGQVDKVKINNSTDISKVKSPEEAAVKIQKWWKGNKGKSLDEEDDEFQGGDAAEEDLKHRIRHKRTEEYIRHLESEVTRLKSSLTAERKLRSLQFEAIRSLWSQVQKITANNPDQQLQQQQSLMTQSCPSGLPRDAAAAAAAATNNNNAPPQPCTCTKEIENLKNKIETEMTDLRNLVSQLLQVRTAATTEQQQHEGKTTGEESTTAAAPPPQPSVVVVSKRPDTLDLGGNGGGVKHGELQGYADSVAKIVVSQGVANTTTTTTTTTSTTAADETGENNHE